MSKDKIGPCDNCPWRKDAPVGYWDEKHFTDIYTNCQDDGMSLMLCHKSKVEQGLSINCAGALLVLGYKSIGARIAHASGKLDLADYGTEAPLYITFEDMLKANKVKIPRRNRVRD